MHKLVLLISFIMLCTGCTSYHSLLDGLSERQVTSCVWFMGNAGPYASVRVVTATGGADLAKCMQH